MNEYTENILLDIAKKRTQTRVQKHKNKRNNFKLIGGIKLNRIAYTSTMPYTSSFNNISVSDKYMYIITSW